MINCSNKVFNHAALLVFFVLIDGLYSCVRRDCAKSYSFKETRNIQFLLKDKITGKDILTYAGSIAPVPDSIKLKNIKIGFFYQLLTAEGGNNSVHIYSTQYNRPVDVVDSLVFYFGNAVPDTLLVHTGIIEGWRGDECPSGKDAGINKVTLRGQVLVQTNFDDALIVLQK